LFTKFFTLYPPKYVKLLTVFTLYFLVFVVLYYSVLGFGPGIFLIAIPPLLTASTSFLPHIVTYKLGLLKRDIFIKLANLSLLAVAISLGMLSLAAIFSLGTLSAEIILIYSITLPCITFSTSILLFSPLGKSLGLYTKVDCQHNQYYATWILFPPISLLIVAFWPLFLGQYIRYVLGILFLSISLHLLFRWSVNLGKMSNKRSIVAIILNSIVFASIVLSIPTIIGLELFRIGLQFPTLEVASFTSFILLACVYLFETNSSRFQFKPEVKNALKRVELFSWLCVKAVLCLVFAIILPLPSIIEKVLVVIILASILSPITLVYLKKAGMEVRNLRLKVDQLIAAIFTVAIAGLYVISYWPSASVNPIFVITPILGFALGGCNVFLFLNLSSVAYKRSTTKFQPQLTNDEVPARDSPGRKWGAFFGVTSALFVVFFFQDPIISPLFLLMTYLITLTFRNSNPLFRVIQVVLLSFATYINGLLFINFHANAVPVDLLSTFFHIFAVNLQQNYFALGDHILFYLISLLTVLLFSIGLNRKQKSLFEALSSFLVVSSIVFLSLQLFSNILFPNIIVISVLAFLLQLTPFLFYYKHPYAIWFANACVVLLAFICLNYLSYQVLFVPADVGTTKNILALTLTLSGTLFTFVLRFNKLPEKYRRYSYVGALTALIVAIPTFVYFLLLESMPALKSPISLAISLNFGILLFFLSTAIYQWRFSRAIWQSAWGAWLLLPLVNYVIIAELLGGIDLATNALSFFGTLGVPGSLILSIILCTLLYLPLFYTKVKIHFHKILFFIWGETLFLVAWIAQMLFGLNVLLSTGFFGIMAIFLLIPLLYLLKAWKILLYFWIFMITINAVYVYEYLSFLGITLENVLSINLIVVGLFLIILSFFPQLQHRMQLLTISYGIVLTGVFFLIYFAIVAVTLNPFVSVNISFIILALSLFSSKYLKLNQKNIHFAIAVILISNSSLLVLFSFIFIPGLELFAVFFSLAVFGGSFYVFNWFEIIKPIDSRIPWGIMALGFALAISDLFFVFWQVNVMFLGFTFSLILLIFLFRNLHSYKYALWVFYPIPFTFLIQGFLLPFLGSGLIFGWVATYIALFQITFNLFHRRAKTRTASPQRRYLEILQRSDVAKEVNSVCFLLNSVFIAILATVASPLSWINQILEFLILWSLFTIISLKYMKTAISEKIGQGFFRYLQGITLLFYIVVPFDVCFNIFDVLLSSDLQISYFVTLIGLSFSGILFFETVLIDRLWVVGIFP
jgi:hypothetical protein